MNDGQDMASKMEAPDDDTEQTESVLMLAEVFTDAMFTLERKRGLTPAQMLEYFSRKEPDTGRKPESKQRKRDR